MTVLRSTVILVAISLVAAGCGGSDETKSSVSAKDRIAACLEQQPDATQGDCEGWEKDRQLGDDGKHQDHESMS